MSPCRLRPFLAATTALLLASAAPASAPPARVEPPAPADPGDLESVVDGLVSKDMAAAGVPGLVLVLVQDGRTVLAKGYGLADLEGRVPMTPQTNLRAGSVSKPVSATVVLRLVERGQLALEAPIDRYLPGLVRPDSHGSASSVSQLLTMTAGYTDDVLKVHAPTPAEFRPLGEFLERRLAARELRPGIMSYSSWNLALLGHAIERITGESFDRVVDRELFLPLGMTRSSFAQPLPRALASGLATGYSRDGGRLRIVPHDLVSLSPGIALVTTGEDLGRFMAALLAGGPGQAGPLLKEEGLRGLLTRQAGAHPWLRGRSYGFSEAPFGPPGTVYHDGNGIGFGSRMILVPGQRIGIFVSVNHRPLDRFLAPTPAFDLVRELAVKVLERVAPGEPPARPLMRALPDAARRAGRYAGQYQAASASRHNLLKVGMLFDCANVRPGPDGTLSIGAGRYAEVEPAVFQNRRYPNVLAVFQEDGAGHVRYLTFGGTGTYEKVPWHGRFGLQVGLAVAAGLVSLVQACLWPFRRRGPALAWLLSLVNLGFVAGFAAFMAAGDLLLLFKTIPWSLRFVLVLPWAGAVLAALLLVGSPAGGREETASPWVRFSPRLVALAGLTLLGQAVYWRLFPW